MSRNINNDGYICMDWVVGKIVASLTLAIHILVLMV